MIFLVGLNSGIAVPDRRLQMAKTFLDVGSLIGVYPQGSPLGRRWLNDESQVGQVPQRLGVPVGLKDPRENIRVQLFPFLTLTHRRSHSRATAPTRVRRVP